MRFNEVICWVVLSLAILSCDAIIPDAAIELFSASNTDLSAPTLSVFASTALFGPRLDFRNPAPHDGSNLMPLILPPDDNALLCNEPPSNATSSLSDSILLIPKGGCTYKRKVYHAQLLGAQHAIIHATLASEYNSPAQNPLSVYDTTYPIRYVDYECGNGRSYIPETELRFDKFPYDPGNDDLLSGSSRNNNLCAIYHNLRNPSKEKRFENTCQSQRCVFTGNKNYDVKNEIVLWESCCAWDLFSAMGDYGLDKFEVKISSSFLTMEEGDNVLRFLKEGSVTAIVFARWYPPVNVSSVLVALITILTIWIASKFSCREYNNVLIKLEAVDIPEDENAGDSENPPIDNVVIDINGRNEIEDAASNAANVARNAVVEEQLNLANGEHQRDATSENVLSNAEESSERSRDGLLDEIHERDDENVPLQVAAPPQNNAAPLNVERNLDEEIVQEREIDFFLRGRLNSRVTRLLAFVALLGVAFIFLTRLLDILIFSYGIAGSLSVVNLLIHPGCQAVVDRIACLKPCRKPLCARKVESLDIVTMMAGLGVGITWLGFVFSNTMAHTHPFYWIVQDIMNFALCIVVLNSIRLKSIKIPASILVVSFIYNTTALFEDYKDSYQYDDGFERTEGTGEDYLRCEKYAGTDLSLRCNPFALPFAFVAIPRVNDYRGGFSSFRFIDILLPGILCTFIARYDTAKNIIKALDARERAARRGIRNVRDLIPKKKGLRRYFSGYHYQTIIGFYIALAISGAVLACTRDKQSVLLYVVPLTLGPVVIRGVRRGEFSSLWAGPRRFHLSNLLVSIIAQGDDRAIRDLGFDVGDSNTVGTMSVVSFSDSEIEWDEEEEAR
jgi:hypothetical protein